MTSRSRSPWIALVLAGSVVAAGACGSDQDPVVGPSGPTTTRAAAGSSTTGSAAEGFGLTEVAEAASTPGLLASVEATQAGGVDRVTFGFEGEVPGYRVGYVERPIVEDGSGEEITVDGDAVLAVRFEPAAGFDLTGEGRQVYRGPTRLDLATRVVVDVVRTGDFEAVLQWAVGVDTEAPFRVRTDTSPGRIIVEVQVPGG